MSKPKTKATKTTKPKKSKATKAAAEGVFCEQHGIVHVNPEVVCATFAK